MDDVVVVGGGIIGAATAYFLSKEGRKVKVIERDPTYKTCLLYTSPSPRDRTRSRMPSSA